MKLKLADCRVKLPFPMNRGLSAFTMQSVIEHQDYNLDFDVFLPSLGVNLQRDFIWSLDQKRELIWSVLKGIKIPPMAFVHYNHEVFQVIDGKQRIKAWLDFIRGEFFIIHQNNPYYFCDLDGTAQLELTHTYIVGDVAYEYPHSPIADEHKIAWFNLINFAGTPVDKKHMFTLEKLASKKCQQ
jgi:hypothetical protein